MKLLCKSECHQFCRVRRVLALRSLACVGLHQTDIRVYHRRLQQNRHSHFPLQLVATDADQATKAIVSLGKQVGVV